MSRLVKFLLGLVLVLVIAVVYVLNPRLPVPEGARSAALYQESSFGISQQSLELVDRSRPTAANGDFEGQDFRELNGIVWYPDTDSRAPYPLVVYSHGFMSSVAEAQYLVEFLVPRGYAVVAVDYPLSSGGAPGGPTVNDVIHQPGDVSFLIDALMARSNDPADELHQMLDSSRIAAVGLSLGGLTTQLAAFHRDVRDPRLVAAVSIAGPSVFLEPDFFRTSDMPFMMIAGSSDAIIPYEEHAAPIPGKVDNSLLVTLDLGTHVGFANIATTFMRWFRHPDRLACPMLLSGLEDSGGDTNPMLTPDQGIGISDAQTAPCTMEDFPRAMRPGQQQMLTRLAVYAFLESVMAVDPARREVMAQFLEVDFPAENAAAFVD